MWAPDYKLLVIAALTLVCGVQTVRLHTEETAHLQSKLNHNEALRGIADKTVRAQQAVAAYQQAISAELVAKDQQHTKELTYAHSENNRLRLAARAGTVSVRLKGYACTGSTGTVPTPTFTSSLGHGRAETDGELRENFFDHRAALTLAESQIRYLQDYARTCQKEPTP